MLGCSTPSERRFASHSSSSCNNCAATPLFCEACKVTRACTGDSQGGHACDKGCEEHREQPPGAAAPSRAAPARGAPAPVTAAAAALPASALAATPTCRAAVPQHLHHAANLVLLSAGQPTPRKGHHRVHIAQACCLLWHSTHPHALRNKDLAVALYLSMHGNDAMQARSLQAHID